MNIRTLETFVWIARLGSFRAAASRVYASQPSVSARIAGLEDQLGIELFDRSGKKITLAAKGREFLVYAEKMLSLHREMMQAVAKPSSIRKRSFYGVVDILHVTERSVRAMQAGRFFGAYPYYSRPSRGPFS